MPEQDTSVTAETDAISTLVAAMEPMDAEARKRVMRYLADRFGIGVTSVFPHAYSYR